MYTNKTQKTRLYTVSEVSKLFHVNGDTVRRMIKDGRLEATKGKKLYYITEESIKRLVKGEAKQ